MSGRTHRFQVGDFTCIAVCDSESARPVRGLFTNVSDEEAARAAQALGYDRQALPMSATPLLIDTDTQRVLIDTGHPQGESEGQGQQMRHLIEEGVMPEDIAIVVLTHGHGDHIGGLTDAGGNLSYPNARYFMWKSDWDHWLSEKTLAELGERGAARKALLLAIQDEVTLIEAETEIAPGIRLVPMHGHTPGHCGVWLQSGGETLLHVVDAIHTPMQLQHPEWHFVFDSIPDAAVATRREWFARAAAEGWLVATYHLPFPGLGRIVADGDAWRWQPLA